MKFKWRKKILVMTETVREKEARLHEEAKALGQIRVPGVRDDIRPTEFLCGSCGGRVRYEQPPTDGYGIWEGYFHVNPELEHFDHGWIK
jgi:hypothetical protein